MTDSKPHNKDFSQKDLKPKHIVILTGAGISAESGIRTFRATNGLWEDHRIEDVATPEGFAANPDLVHQFYNQRRAQLTRVEPNSAHIALARLEKTLKDKGGSLTLVTQNVDDLHERGGSENIIHMHGELNSVLCTSCAKRQKPWHAETTRTSLCPHCNAASLRPDIVWFGEMPYHMKAIDTALAHCDLFVSIGTSGAVYPAAGYVQSARQMGKATLELNLEPSQGSHFFDQARYGKATKIVPQWVEAIITEG